MNVSKLTEYKGKRGIYYFENPHTRKRMHNVIFDQGHAIENEDFELLRLNHPFIIELIRHLDASMEEHVTAKLLIREDNITGEKGFVTSVPYTHLRANETPENLVCRLLLEKIKTINTDNDCTLRITAPDQT